MSESPQTAVAAALHGKRVLVTGHTGFKGGWLAAWLHGLGAEVTGFALDPPTHPSFFERVDLAARIDHRVGDVGDADAVGRLIAETAPEVIFHLAAQSLVRPSYADPLETFQTNVMGTAHVLDAVRREGRPCHVIVVTSDKCYENREDGRAYAEDDSLGGYDPYSASKGAAEIATAAYRRAFFPVDRYDEHGVTVASARAGNVIGGGDWATDRIVPDVVRALELGKPVEVRSPGAIRPWQHVLDALSGYVCLAERLVREGAQGHAEAWNFGPAASDARTVGELVSRLLEAWGQGEARHASLTDQPHEAGLLHLSSAKARERLGWQPAFDLDDTIRATVAWYRAATAPQSPEPEELFALTLEQIHHYESCARRAGLAWAAS